MIFDETYRPFFERAHAESIYDQRFGVLDVPLAAVAARGERVGLEGVVAGVKGGGCVASPDGFTCQPGVINGASELFGEVFGEAGRHARSAVGVAVLPLDAPVEVEVVVEVTAA